MDPAVPTSVAIPEGCCVFCDSPSQSIERYGKFLHHEESGIYAHYYCMLFACGLSQRGETHEGIEGFLIKDILAERKRAQKLKCKYCKKKGASVGCSVKACHQIYHYGCGVDEEAIFLFYDSFVSYCAKHRPVQKVLPSSCSPSKGTCPICMEHVETTPGNSVLKTPCCKGTWLHRDCVQTQALSAGYFFRCAICNNENEFQDEMKKFGIYLPEKDADWEFGAEAYQELYERHNRCDVDKCRCPRGRKYSTQSGQWEIVLCDLCGSAGCHVSCGGLVTSLDDWACKDCTSTFTKGFLEQNPATDRRGTVKLTSSPRFQQKRTPGHGGTRVRSAIRSQGKRPRPPPTTPRPLKKTKHSSTPVCPPLSPVSSQQSSVSNSPKSTPCPTMKFPRVSLSPTYDREDSGSGTSRESFGSKYRELLPKLDCYVALEPPSRDFPCPNLSMPSLTPASNSAKKHKSSNKLKCKKARKLDLNACNLQTETIIAQKFPAKGSSSGSGKDSTVKLSWGSRLLDSVGSFLWRRSPSKAKASECSEVSQEKTATYIDTNDIQKSTLSQMQHTHVPNLPSSSLESPESHPKSNSPVALSEEVKSQIVPVGFENTSNQKRNLLHDLTSWKDDSTWKEAKHDLAHLFQVEGRATRSALKKDGKTPVKSAEQERKTSNININDMVPKDSLHEEQLFSVHSTSSNSHDHVCSHPKSSSPVVLSKEIKAQINPLISKNVPSKTKNLLQDLTSWKDDSTWKEAKQDLAHLFQVDGRATRSTFMKNGKTPVKTSEQERKATCINRDDSSQKPSLQKEHSDIQGTCSSLELHDGRATRSTLTKNGKTPVKTSELEQKVTCINRDDSSQKPSLQKEHSDIRGTCSSLELHDGRATRSTLTKNGKTPVKTSEQEQKVTCINRDDSSQKPSLQKEHSDIQGTCSSLELHDGRATRSALTKNGKTPIKTSGQERKAICVNRDDISQKPSLPRENSDIQGTCSSLELHDCSHQTSSLSEELSEKGKSPIISLTSKGKPRKSKNLLNDLTSWKDDATWKEAKHDLAHLFQVDGRATRSALKKAGISPAKSLEREKKVNCTDTVDIAEKSPVLSRKLANVHCSLPTSLESIDNPHDSNSPIASSKEFKTPMVPLPAESLSRKTKNLLNDLTSWKDDATWKEAKQDLAHLYQVDGRATRSVLKKDGTQLANFTVPCSPARKKRKLEHIHSSSQSTLSPVSPSGKIRHPMTGRWIRQKASNHDKLNPEKVIQHKLSSSSGCVMKESGLNHDDKQLYETQEQKTAKMQILPATVTKELRALTSWKDDVTWKEAKGDLANLFQVDGRTTRSVMRKDREPESSSVAKESNTTFKIPVSTPLEKSHEVHPNQDVVKTGCKDFGREVQENETNSSISENAKPSKAHTDESNLLPLGPSSTPGKGKKRSCDLQKLTDWKDNQTWKEFREDMAVLLEVDGRTTRKQAQRDGLKGISGSPKVVSPSKQKGQDLSSMPVLTKIVPGGKEASSPNHNVLVKETSSLPSNESHTQAVINTGEEHLKDVNVNSENEKSSDNALIPQSSTQIKDTTSGDVGSYIACETGKEPLKEQKKARKSLSKVFCSNLNDESSSVGNCGITSELGDPRSRKTEITSNARDSEIHGEFDRSSGDVPCNEDAETPSSELNGIDPELSVQDVEKPVLFDRSSQTTANLKEVDAYVTSRGLHYREPSHLPPVRHVGSQDGNFRNEYTQTYDMKYENSNALSIPGNVQNVRNEEDRFDGELTEMPELSDGEITPRKNNNLWKRNRTAPSYSEKKAKDSAVMRQAVGVRRAQSCKKGLRRKGNSYSAPLPPTAATSKISRVKKARHASEPPELSPHEFLSMRGDQEDAQPKVVSLEAITDAGDCKQSFGSHSNQGENVVESGKSFISDAQNEEVIQPEGPNKGTKLDQLLQTDGRHTRHHKEPQSALHISDDTLRRRISPRKKLSHSRCVVLSQEDPSRGELKQPSHSHEGKSNGKEHVEHASTSQISTMLSDVTNASIEIMKEDVLTGCKSSEALPEAAEICRSLVDEILTNALKRSKCRVKRTQCELLGSWKKDGLWKEAKEDVQMLLNAEERITRRSRKDSNEPKNMVLSEGPSLAKGKNELGSSTTIVKPSPSLDLRKRKYCCSHMRSPWKASPLKSKSVAYGILAEPKDPQQFSPVFRKQSNHATDGLLSSEKTCASLNNDSVKLNSPSEANGMKSSVHTTLASVRKVWKPRDDFSDMKKKGGRPKNQAAEVAKPGKNGSLGKQQDDTFVMKKQLGRPGNQAAEVVEPKKNGHPRKQLDDNSVVKRQVGRPRNQAAEVAKPKKIGSLGKQQDDTFVMKKQLGRPGNQAAEVAEPEKNGSPRKQLGDNSNLKRKVGRPTKEVLDIAEPENRESPRKQLDDNSVVKRRMGRPRNQAAEGAEPEKNDSPRKQLPDNSEMKKKVGRPRKYSVDTTDPDETGSPPEKKRPRNHTVDISEQMLDFGKNSNSPNNRKLSDVQSFQGDIAHSRNNKKARRRLEPSATHPSLAKADDDLTVCFMALQGVLQAGTKEISNSATQTDAPVEEVEAYVTSRGKLYLEPCFVMPRPHLDMMEATSDMRTQTYNLELSQCLHDETMRTCPPLVYEKHEAKRPPSGLKKKKTRSKQRANRPPTLEKMNNSIFSHISIASSAKTDHSSQTELPMEEVEAHIQSMGEWYREPIIIVTGSQEVRTEVQNSVRTQTYNVNLPERELPTFKKKFSKRVHTQMKGTQTRATLEEVKAYIEANKQVYTDPKYSTTQSYFLVGSSLYRHIAVQTYLYDLDEATSEEHTEKEEQTKGEDSKHQVSSESEETSAQGAAEESSDYSREALPKPDARDVLEDGEKIDMQTHRQVKSNLISTKPGAVDGKITGNGVSNKVKTNIVTFGLHSRNWFRLKPKK